MKAYLMLGCNGYYDECDMVQCNSAANPILDIEKIYNDNKVVNFIENTAKLLDGPCVEQQVVGNIINILFKNFKVIDEKKLPGIQSFLRMHKPCGVYLMMVLKEDVESVGRDKKSRIKVS